ncbi:hypothetical protein CQW49_21775 (plasmid) [Methylosinus trichosporium OB3b]|uniref:Uncharacterized protein n=1 Tax=Methylosinus trichosporium (strain ATCC 35070 / NCIMB 11131 / UNIQEM 75 / OB3b) TaxID=595536 RepID=A0A2D2D6L8_METT3|nr:hypothetical protein CQW49_21775 [Methylosinus trichosporium OB3b]
MRQLFNISTAMLRWRVVGAEHRRPPDHDVASADTCERDGDGVAKRVVRLVHRAAQSAPPRLRRSHETMRGVEPLRIAPFWIRRINSPSSRDGRTVSSRLVEHFVCRLAIGMRCSLEQMCAPLCRRDRLNG